uniref:non-specific serine/threonine protein kinase n=1 Tax=Clastoptera arizonana TaxID=38151 RepID=A0A1B6DEI4_9HEMI
MGNQLVGIAPSQIFSVDHYLTDLHDVNFDINLGSTRFFKVARAYSQEGLVVIKVFAIHDPTLPLTRYKDKIEEIRVKLGSAVNCLSFHKVVLTDRAGYLMRQYIKFSLYDRISTRPFLTQLEKKWIAFQILYSLHQCHKVGVCHGDIKLENILVTSWHWVLLSDFASYKPTHLPEDNPADFSYFFDTSRRRSCYIAPERFIKSLVSDMGSQLLWSEEIMKKGDLTPSMDIFSAGCALAELFSDGHSTFDFSQLLAYRSGEDTVEKHLQEIEDDDICELVQSMIQKDPAKRLSAEHYLAQERGRIFPEYFYSFLHSYMLIFSSTNPIMSCDEKIERLYTDIHYIVNMLKDEEKKEKDSSNDVFNKNGCDPLVIIISLVTSCIRGLHLSNSKLQCLETLLVIASRTPSETILDRILPYILYLVHDLSPRVRVSAIHTLTKCLSFVDAIPLSDTNIFPEYILPELAMVALDENVIVRTAYAENIATIAETALRFLEYCQVAALSSIDSPIRSYETELATLHEMIQQTVATLLTDPQNIVKQTLIENGITKLCVFFGKQKANDILLSHMITFLNDKEDKQLRTSFFDCIVGVAAYIGIHSSPILSPLLQQGMTDVEEFVVRRAIITMTTLTELNLLHKSALYELLPDTACFLVHPNLWIRHAVVGFISTLARVLNEVDVQCKVLGVIQQYLKYPLIQLEIEVLLLYTLLPHIPRVIYESVIRCNDLEIFLHTLADRQKARGKGVPVANTQLISLITVSPKQTSGLRNLFSRLYSDGMTEKVEDQLLSMARHLHKIHRHTINVEPKPVSSGKIDLGSLRNPVQCHAAMLSHPNHNKTETSLSTVSRRGGPEDYNQLSVAMNEEWRHMFGVSEAVASSKQTDSIGKLSASTVFYTESQNTIYKSIVDTEYLNVQESYIQCRYAPCKLELQKLISRKEELYTMVVRAQEWAEHEAWVPPLPPPGWRLRGALVAHLHEHKAAVNRLVPIPESSLFASCSSDGNIRVWDCGKMEGKNIANRSQQVYNGHDGALMGLTLCNNNQFLATVSSNGSVSVIKLEGHSSKLSLFQSRVLDQDEEGIAIDIAHFDNGTQSVVVYATTLGSIIGWDLRAPGIAWKMENNLKKGVITAMCLDSRQCYLALGTSSGYHCVYDLRFQMPITSFPQHPQDRAPQRVRRLIRHPSESSWILSAMQGHNEIAIWNIESATRQVILWGSQAPPLSLQVNNHSVCGMFAGNVDRSPFLLAGGTDQRVRYWDLDSYSNSYLGIPAGNDFPGQTNFSYCCRMIDGTNVVQEVQSVSLPPSGFTRGSTTADECPRAGPDQPPTGHHDGILDISMCQASQCFLMTGSRDGVIKVWK